jgi:hypothetical protein
VHVYVESGNGGKEVQSLSVDVSVVVADDWEETSRMRVTAGKVYHHLVVLGSFGRTYLLMASLPMLEGQVVTTIPTSIQRRLSPIELRVGYDILLLAASSERGFTAPYTCRDSQ